MAEFDVKTDNMNYAGVQLNSIAGILRAERGNILSISNSLSFKIASSSRIKSRLKMIAEQVDREQRGSKSMSDAIQNSVVKYQNTEDRIVGRCSNPLGAKIISQNDGEKPHIEINMPWYVDMVDIVGKPIYKGCVAALGPIGGYVDFLGKDLAGDGYGKAKALIGIVGNVAGNWSGSKINWGKVFHLVGSDKSAVQQALGKYFDFSSTGKAVSSTCSWIKNGIDSFVDNRKEFSNMNGRFWAETGLETVAGTALDIGVITAVSAAATAVSAPAILTAAVTAGTLVAADAALDWMVTKATHGSKTSWTDAVADVTIDGAKAAYKEAKKAGKAVVKETKKIVNGAKEAGKAAGKAVGNFAKNIFGSRCRWCGNGAW